MVSHDNMHRVTSLTTLREARVVEKEEEEEEARIGSIRENMSKL